MRFYLVYNGLLPSAGNSAKPRDVVRIRRELSPQLQNLWDTHGSLQRLKEDAAITPHKPLDQLKHINDPLLMQMLNQEVAPTQRDLAAAFPDEFIDLLEPLEVGDTSYRPLVRKSLDLSCELSVLFLRQEDPGQLISQGGDLDGRIKTLLDALRMPKKDEQDRNTPIEDELFCLMEDDALVSGLSVETDRLLSPRPTDPMKFI